MHENIGTKICLKAPLGLWGMTKFTKIRLQPALPGKNRAAICHMCMLNHSFVASENLFQSASQTFSSIMQEISVALLQVLFLQFCVDSLHWHPLYWGRLRRTTFAWASQTRAQLVLACSCSYYERMVLLPLAGRFWEKKYQEVYCPHITKINICQRYCLVSAEQVQRHIIMSLMWTVLDCHYNVNSDLPTG